MVEILDFSYFSNKSNKSFNGTSYSANLDWISLDVQIYSKLFFVSYIFYRTLYYFFKIFICNFLANYFFFTSSSSFFFSSSYFPFFIVTCFYSNSYFFFLKYYSTPFLYYSLSFFFFSIYYFFLFSSYLLFSSNFYFAALNYSNFFLISRFLEKMMAPSLICK